MKILVLSGDQWHPADIPWRGLGALGGSGLNFDFLENADDWPPENLSAYPLVILAKANDASPENSTGWMTESVQIAFAEYVRTGNGLLAVHNGTAGYENAPILRALLGGVFLHHPEQCPVTVMPQAGHALTDSVTPFTLPDEHYFMALDDSSADVFLRTQSEHGQQPGGWRRSEGSGRVAVLTPGHNLDIWLHPSFQALLRNSIRWCCGNLC
jgi:uncharacterized protein